MPAQPAGAVLSPDGVKVMPMRIKANQDRAAAAVRLYERHGAPRSMLPASTRQGGTVTPPAQKDAPGGGQPSAGGGAVKRAAAALLELTLAQTGPPDLYSFPNYANSKFPIATCSANPAVQCVADADCPGYAPPFAVGVNLYPGGETCTGPVVSGGIKKFVDGLPTLCALGKNNLGQCLPLAVPDTQTYSGSDYYELGLKQYEARFHSDITQPAKVRGYYQKGVGGDAGVPHYLGPIILAKKDVPVRVRFVNEIDRAVDGDLFLPVDETVAGAGAGPLGGKYSPNRATLHLHGGNTPWISDGTQHQWVAPKGEATPYKKGLTTAYVPDMWFTSTGAAIPSCAGLPACAVPGATNDPGDGTMTFYWTNQQSGRLMFYHDHAYGITRLNVYAGEAAGYLLVNPPDEDALATATVPGTIGSSPATTDLAHMFPLVIQDKTFVPPPSQLAAQDPTWNTTTWGGEGNFWFPHVYTPNQWPDSPDLTGCNPMGRWDYGPWFWPPQTSLTVDGVNRPLTKPCWSAAAVSATNPSGMTQCPNIPDVSLIPESFMDTMVVNGTAYPTVTVDPVAYRFQILNAANERNINLSFFQADASGTEVTMIDAVPHSPSSNPLPLCRPDAAVNPATGLPTNCWPITWPIDARYGGVPDPRTAGPAIIQIGSEGGILPAPAVIPAQPVNYEYNRRNIVVLNVSDKGLFIGPAERADVVVDFSAFAGKTLILYNDAPAPVPAADPRIDYFTGNQDQTLSGGAPTTHPGYGPNTRTIMQVVVRGTAQTPPARPPLDTAALAQALAARFAVSQPAPIVPASAFSPVYATTLADTYLPIQARELTFTPVCATTNPPTCADPNAPQTLQLAWKAIHELFDMGYGRMNSLLGVEVPLTSWLNQTTIPYFNFDPTTEFITDDKPQIWKITHNGVDTHTIHFHLLNAQVVNRVGWDGQIRPPDANELGWKESVRMHPLEDIYVALRPVKQNLPWPLPDMFRPIDVTKPLGTATQFTGVDINNNPIPVENAVANFGWEYVWHCHLLGHEEDDMLRAEVFVVAPEAPSDLVANAAGAPVALRWTDNSKSALTFRVERSTTATFDPGTIQTSISIASPGVGPQTVTFTDTGASPGFAYFYRVRAEKELSTPSVPGVSYPAFSGWSNTLAVVIAPLAGISPTSLSYPNLVVNTTSAPQTVTVSNTGTASLSLTSFTFTGPNAADFKQTNACGGIVAIGGTCNISVTAKATAAGARSATLTIATNDPAHPTLTVGLSALAYVYSPATGVTLTPSTPSPHVVGSDVTFTAAGQGSTAPYQYQFWVSTNGGASSMVQDYGVGASWTLIGATQQSGTYQIQVRVRTNPAYTAEAWTAVSYVIAWPRATGVTVTTSVPSPQTPATSVAFNAAATGPASVPPSAFQYQFWLSTNQGATYSMVQDYGVGSSWTMAANTLSSGTYYVHVKVRTNTTSTADAWTTAGYILAWPAATGVTLTPSVGSPQAATTSVAFAAAATGPATVPSSAFQYQFWVSNNGAPATMVQNFGVGTSWTMVGGSLAPGMYYVTVRVRTNPSSSADAWTTVTYKLQ